MKTTTNFFLTLCMTALATFSFHAQVATLYSFSQFQGTYTAISGGTAFSTSLFDDQDIVDPTATPIVPPSTGSGISIGFNFLFDNIVFDKIGISNNGYIMLGNSSNGTSAINEQISDWNRPISSTSSTGANFQHRISPFGNDLLAKTTSSITVQTLGSAPTRTCVIQWTNYQRYAASPTGSDNINFQLRLSETSNIIDAVYGTIVQLTEDTLVEVGLRGGSNTDFNNRDVTNPNVWATSIPGTLSTSACRYNSTKVPASGLTYRWATPQCSGPLATLNTTATVASVCPGANFNVSLQNSYTVAGISYTWSNSTSSSTGPYTVMPNPGGATQNSLTIGAPNWYQVSAICINNNATTTSTPYNVTVAQAPTLTAIASPTTLCSGNSLTLNAVGNATAYTWTGGYTNGVGFPASVTATYVVTGTSSVGCTATASVPVSVVQTPIQPISVSPFYVCVGSSATLTAPSALNYTWTSATQTVYTSSLVITPTSAGTTTYTVIKSNAPCVDTKTISVVTNSLPGIFAIVTPTLVCALNPATLAIGGAQTYTWTAPGSPNFTFTGAGPIVYPSSSSTYSVAASNGTCNNSTTVFLAVNPNPTIVATASSPSICYGQSVTLNATGGINYTWTATTGVFTTQTVTDFPTSATSYNVMADNSFGCTSGANIVVLVNPNPTITATPNKPIVCSGGPTTLTAIGATTYTWDANANGALTASTLVNPMSPTSSIMIYTVQGSNSYPCQSSATVQVNVFVPILTATGNTNTCEGGVIHLTAGGGNANSYVWFTSATNTYSFAYLSATVTAPAIYTLNATVSTPIVCPATQTVAVGVYYNPTITAVPQRTIICTKESVNLYGGGGATYLWDNGSPGGTITVSPTGNTTYTVTGTDANGCVGTATVLVKVSGCSGINELNGINNQLVLYPNPNNGEFTIQANTDITLILVNELGQTIRSIALSESNNYKFSVNDLSTGIYFITGQKDNVRFNQKVVVTR